ncbi:PPE domain-containing protein [Kitasatospora sp. NPDC049258]|uniref:WXG100 family type VII secretion target n=1 Tax=Kitasatospora sp. NPDC049258 TaxID=3155394 RepID=UPI00342AC780
MSMPSEQGASDAYAWTRQSARPDFPAIPEAKSPDREGISGALDEAVEWTLEKTGVLEWLEKVTGAPELLSEAAHGWRDRAVELARVADDLRAGAVPLAGQWQGAASDNFARHTAQIVEAVDATAEDMSQTAQILGQAAKECELAEETVIHLISELIDLLIAQLATSFILDLVSFGLATVVDALVSGAEVAVYVERISAVSVRLGKALEELLKAVKELKEAQRAGKPIKEILAEAKKVRSAAADVRKTAKALSGKKGKEEGLSFLQRQAVGAPAKIVGKGLKELGIDKKWTGPLKDYAKDEDGRRSLLDDGDEAPPAYHVDRGRIEQAFG